MERCHILIGSGDEKRFHISRVKFKTQRGSIARMIFENGEIFGSKSLNQDHLTCYDVFHSVAALEGNQRFSVAV